MEHLTGGASSKTLPTHEAIGDETDSSEAPPAAAPMVAALTGGAAIVHFAMAPVHAEDSTAEAVGFAIAGWAQAVLAVMLLLRPKKPVLGAAAIVNLTLIALWAWSRTVGLPIGAEPGVAESATWIDLTTVALQTGAVIGAVVRLSRPTAGTRLPAIVPAIGAIAVFALATAVVASPDAAEHNHGDGTGGDEHDHGGSADQDAQLAVIQDTRCDLDLNPTSYYEETELIGVDTVSRPELAGHDHTSQGILATDPLQGRGSPLLDEATGLMNTQSEGEAGYLTALLGDATDEEYQSFLYEMAIQNAGGSGHDAHAASGDDTEGHGGHFGPQPWIAMTDEAQCSALRDELDTAREVALRYPTAADAQAGGYRMVTTYVPGIASHWMNFSYVDGTFEVDKPEMLLYDGSGPDASVIGLSYYVIHDADTEPTQGFTGDNDHYHRHVGLCVRGTVVVGDTTMTEEECSAVGGRKQTGGGAGWMSHAWVVPGCESPWGMFSGVNPLLDGTMGDNAGTEGSQACAGSGVLDRYDLSPGGRDNVSSPEDEADPDERASG